MCLYVENDEWTPLASGTRRARIAHKCYECNRVIEPGETYHYWTGVDDNWGRIETYKGCAHCIATIDLGCALTGCDRGWYWDKIHDLDPDDGGFVGDVLVNHHLAFADEFRILRRVLQRRRQWRRPNGELYALPEIPVPVSA